MRLAFTQDDDAHAHHDKTSQGADVNGFGQFAQGDEAGNDGNDGPAHQDDFSRGLAIRVHLRKYR